ncbi:uncharacterized protein BXZ73DRAFT_107776 [Epithele typhae]|uniref:uncharacterized protein n=1 Tax=Epithele typhae TaxID=378194 RepID=UPI0020077D86|nr:uncharacterized protein BXZ73DRAFT_107776 [Epithele typhae]KAH9911816.1 hypothetical protein BXZ73DRAFT_107776 [Epithele typhae]
MLKNPGAEDAGLWSVSFRRGHLLKSRQAALSLTGNEEAECGLRSVSYPALRSLSKRRSLIRVLNGRLGRQRRETPISKTKEAFLSSKKQLLMPSINLGQADLYRISDDDEDTRYPADADDGRKAKPSIRFNLLPTWIQPFIKTSIIPALIADTGTRSFPWDIDGPQDTDFLYLVRKVVKAVCPRSCGDVSKIEKGHIIYRFARQAVYQIVPKTQPFRLINGKVLGSASGYASACQRTSEIFYGIPPDMDCVRLFYTPPMLTTIAFHLLKTQGSSMPYPGHPVGAIALCAAAINQVCSHIANPIGDKWPKFSQKNVGTSTMIWYESVESLTTPEKLERFAHLLEIARSYIPRVPVLRGSKKTPSAGADQHIGHLRLRDLPSSPIRGDDDLPA